MNEVLDKLNPEVKAKWLEALRSGKYEQGQESLNEDGKFCCLGVLCEVAIKQGVEIEINAVEEYVRYDDEGSVLPLSVMSWSGFTKSLPDVGHPVRGVTSLSGLNDNGVPFTEIADLIEEYL